MVNNKSAQLDGIFAALSDPTRREMLARLSTREMSVQDLATPFAMSKPAISKHLKVLEQAGLLIRRIEGRTHICSLRPQPLEQASEWIRFYETFWNQRLDGLEQMFAQSQNKDDDDSA